MQYKAESPEDYISQLPEDRKDPMKKAHKLIKNHMPQDLESGMGYGMPAYFVPKSVYPAGYHCKPFPPLPFISIASQKNFIALYHMGLYAKKELYDWFIAEYPNHAKYKLDMGKSCIRFKKVDDIPYDLIKELLGKMTVKEWIEIYETSIKNKQMKLGAFSISLSVKDLGKSKTFYEALGFNVFAGSMEQNYLILKNGNALIGIFQGMFENNILTFNPGWDENANKIDDFDDVRTIQKSLKDNDITLTTEADANTTGPASAVVIDPDGNMILLDQHV